MEKVLTTTTRSRGKRRPTNALAGVPDASIRRALRELEGELHEANARVGDLEYRIGVLRRELEARA